MKTTILIFLLFLPRSVSADETTSSDVFPRQFLAQYCRSCHSGSAPKGEFHEESLSQDFADENNRQKWLSVLEQLREGTMPPKDKPRPQESDVKRIIEWITGQWLGLQTIDATSPDGMLYPEYDDVLKVSMVKEVLLFFDEVLKNDLSLAHFAASDFSMLNGRLAKHYGIPGVEDGLEFRKVMLPPGSHRGGVLTMGAILKVTANGTTTSPILRGAWVLDRILGTPPPKPTVDVEAVEPDIRGATTIRAQLAKHRDNTQCAGCDASSHSVKNLPVLLCGGGFRHGQHLCFDPQNPPPLCNLYVSMLQRLGIELDTFSNSTGTLTGLEATG